MVGSESSYPLYLGLLVCFLFPQNPVDDGPRVAILFEDTLLMLQFLL